jgi:hypothetical protein
MKLVRTAQNVVLEHFRPEILASPGSIAEEHHLADRRRSVEDGPSAGLHIVEAHPAV